MRTEDGRQPLVGRVGHAVEARLVLERLGGLVIRDDDGLGILAEDTGVLLLSAALRAYG